MGERVAMQGGGVHGKYMTRPGCLRAPCSRRQYFLPLAGITSLCPQPSDGAPRPPSIGCVPKPDGSIGFSAYRVHAGHDPLTFEGERAAPANGTARGLAVWWRNGEPGHGHGPVAVNATSFALVYQW